MNTYRIAAIPGDGIGNEVIPASVDVLAELAGKEGFTMKFEPFDWGSERYKKTGAYIPAGGLAKLKTFDAILFGAVDAPDVPDHVSLWGLRLPICQGFDQYANVRPTRALPGVRSPLEKGADNDWVVIRENSDGEYSGSGGRVHTGLPEEVATETSVLTRKGCGRIHGSAFDITGKGVANPIATFWTAAMMLEHLGEPKAAARLMTAIERTCEEQVFTPDLGGVYDTRAVTNAMKRSL